MHTYKFTATTDHRVDFDNPEDAIQRVEAAGSGRVVQFIGSRNLPNCLPETVYSSLAMWSYQDGEWWSHYIFSGSGEKIAQEKPHW